MSETKRETGFLKRLFGRDRAVPGREEERPDEAPVEDAPEAAEPEVEGPAAAKHDGGEPIAEVSAEEAAAAAEPAEVLPETVGEQDVPEQAREPVPDLPRPDDAAPEEESGTPRRSWFQKLKDGLSKSSRSLTGGIADIFTKRKLDDDTLQDLEDILIQADLGVDTAMRITEKVAAGRYDKEVSPEEVKSVLAEEVSAVLSPLATPLAVDEAHKPFVILTVGVNGSGKTTTIGKLAAQFSREGRSVMLAAGDTFRAAAVEQLKVWGERTGVPVVSRETGADASGLAFDALKQAREERRDVLIIDTAGRLQNKSDLMAELQKIVRVLKKQDETAPHAVLLVLDATTGQNAMNQVDIFQQTAGVTGLVMTKLDGTARGGILVAIADRFGLPIHAIGVGEGVDDLQPFEADAFARAIAGLE
ncbi:signal recognition particle-docking protein FtsY [Kaustia mangrovi]|uniref:Signal recognition particle receptor FtsY n=1 Tax=Kaustia mangrovi TaxID=2593653 RepID=A0A7S8C2W2_9HYPH|nr:signal recognition particle-docking protein FtsY [Kaustia mangrovi]QPC42332.1 signal recognition particle-docking protein FtsY [Kaustia mangrovi]